MKYTLRISAFLLVSTLFFMCSNEEELPEICLKDVCIKGEWNWIKSSGSIAGITITPETEMYTRKLIIDETYYSEYIDDSLVLQTTYEYLVSEEIKSFSTDSLLLKLDVGFRYAVSEENGKLILTDPCFDCWSSTFEKD